MDITLTSDEEALCDKLQRKHKNAGSWCWIGGAPGESFVGFNSPEEAFINAKENNAKLPIQIKPLKTKVK